MNFFQISITTEPSTLPIVGNTCTDHVPTACALIAQQGFCLFSGTLNDTIYSPVNYCQRSCDNCPPAGGFTGKPVDALSCADDIPDLCRDLASNGLCDLQYTVSNVSLLVTDYCRLSCQKCFVTTTSAATTAVSSNATTLPTPTSSLGTTAFNANTSVDGNLFQYLIVIYFRGTL